MKPKISLTKLIGLPQIDGWSQILTIGQSPQVIVLFAVSGQHAKNVGRDLEEEILSSQMNSAATLYSTLTKMDRLVSQKDCRLSAVMAMINQDKMSLAAIRGGIVLRRDEKVGLLLQADQQIKMLEGGVQVEDKLVLVSDSGWEFKEELFQKLNQGWDIDSIVTSLTTGVHTLENSSLMAFAFVEARDAESEKLITRRVKPKIELKKELENNSEPILLVEQTSVSQAPVSANKKLINKKEFLIKILRILKFKVWSLIKKIFFTFKKLCLKIKKMLEISFSKKEYLGSQKIKKKTFKTIALIGAVVVLLVILISGGLFFRKSQIRRAKSELVATQDLLKQSQDISELDPIKARSLAEQAVDETQAKLKKFDRQIFAKQVIEKELSKSVEYLNSISGQKKQHDLNIFYDFQKEFPQFVGSGVAIYDNQILVLDRDKKQLVLINQNDNQARLIDLKDVSDPRDILWVDGKVYLLDESKILSVDLELGQTTELINDENLADASKITVYLDHVYALSPSKRNVFKFAYSEGEYGDPTRWVRSSPGVEFDQIVSIQIDGSIWLASKQGQVYKLAANQLQDWEVSGIPQEMSGRLILYTSADLNNLYILEPEQQKLIVLNKAGQFIREISSPDLAAASDVVITKDETQALVMNGSLIFSLNLK